MTLVGVFLADYHTLSSEWLAPWGERVTGGMRGKQWQPTSPSPYITLGASMAYRNYRHRNETLAGEQMH